VQPLRWGKEENSMKAIVRSTYGSSDVLELRDIDKPEIANEEVLRREDFAEGDQRYDLILDIGGNSSLSRLRRALASRGILVIVGGEGRGRWLGGTDRQLRAMMLSPFVGQKLGTFVAKENHEDLLVIKELIESGKVTPVIDRTYPLGEAPEAIRYLEEGHARGKVVITV